MITISRRRFLALTGGLLATGCTAATRPSTAPSSSPSTTAVPSTTTPTTTVPTTVTTVAAPSGVVPTDRVLVLVELRGGNDAVNTLPPLTGTYRDLRPSIALPESDLLLPAGLGDHGLHPSLEPLVPYLDDGRLAAVAGIGFEEPNRSHFVSMDRWFRADRLDDELGWLGRWLDTLPDDLPALGATALGSNGEILLGSSRSGTAIGEVDAFAFPAGISNSSVRRFAEPVSDDPLAAAAQSAFAASVGAVEEFDAIADAVRSETSAEATDDIAPLTGAFTAGLAVAAEMILGDVGTRVVTVSAGGFDTHAEQLDVHATLLADLANGLAAFWERLDAAGASDRVLVATISEFGRRVAENASNGCDHGAAGVSLVMGNTINAGLHGVLDTTDLIDGDLRPQIDPRSMFTACLDWLAADVEQILGQRHDDIRLIP